MSTKTQTQTQNSYDPTSMGAFQGLTGSMLPLMQQFMKDPYGSPQFNLEQQMGTSQAQQLGGTQMGNLIRNFTTSGMGGGASSPAGLEMMQNQSRANSGMQANLGFLSPMQSAMQRQMWSMGQAAGYRPLQTGGTQTQTKSGLGTWLPQVIGAGIGLAGMGMAGAGGGGSSPFFGGAGTDAGYTPNSFQGLDPSMWSGQGANSGIQPTSFSGSSFLQ